jgi:hypothetical protein
LIREALQYLVSLKTPQIFVVDGKNYSTEELHYISPIHEERPCISAVTISTLTGLVDYIMNGVDGITGTMIVHVVSPTVVEVYSELRKDARRDKFISCNAFTPRITFEQFMDVEKFIIMMQACFLENPASAAILKVVGNIKEDVVQTVGDNGTTQMVTAKSGISTVENVIVPNPVTLCPFRTFAEVEQPESEFVFRMQTGFKAALFEADGGKWKLYAMQNVKAYLEEKLAGCNVKIIS